MSPLPGTMADVFAGDAFGTITLTAALKEIVYSPRVIQSLKIFREIPIATKVAAVEEERGVLTLVPTTKRGGPGIPARKPKRVATNIAVPRVQLDDTIFADDIIGVRAFGSTEQLNAEQAVANSVDDMARSIAATNEYLRLQALQGKIIYPDDSDTADTDIYTLFGLTDKATNQQAVDFLWATDTTDVIGLKCKEIRSAIRTALGGIPYSRVIALCGEAFFAALIKQGTVRGVYLHQKELFEASRISVVPDHPSLDMVTLGSVTFIEYYGKTGTSDGATNDGTWQIAAEGVAFPLGADIYHTYYAPGDIMEAVKTMGQPLYAYMPIEGKKSQSVEVRVQSNPLNICLRPLALIRLHSST